MTLTFYCRCGASWKGTMPDGDSAKLEAAYEAFAAMHIDAVDNHWKTTAKAAAQQRYLAGHTTPIIAGRTT